MSPRHFVEVRTTYGGPAPSETARALSVSRANLASDSRPGSSAVTTSRPPSEPSANAWRTR